MNETKMALLPTDMSKRKAAGIGQICMSKPTWFDSRSATVRGKDAVRYVRLGDLG